MKATGLLLPALLFLGTPLHAATFYWVDLLPGNWSNALNWSATSGGLGGAGVPGAGDVAVFDGGFLGLEVGNCTLNVGVSVTGITVSAGYTGTISQGASTVAVSGAASFGGGVFAGGTGAMTVGGAFTVAGAAFTSTSATLTIDGNSTFSSGSFMHNNGTVTFAGTALQTITAPSGQVFYDLVVDNGILLNNSISVVSGLTMTAGNVNLGGNNLTLGTSATNTGVLTYTSGAMINTGSFTRWVGASVASCLFPTGTAINYRPFTVSAATAPTTGGTITVAYTDATTNSTVSIPDPPDTIVVRKDLHWTVTTGGGLSGGTYNLDIQGAQYGTIGSTADLRICLAGSVVGTAGVNGGTILDPQINRTGLSLANLENTFYIGSVNATDTPLPLAFLSFTATVVGSEVELSWTTAGGDAVTVERSRNGTTWETLETLADASLAWDPSPYPGVSYYRLGQGKNYSFIRSVDLPGQGASCKVSPNPVSDRLLLTFAGAGPYEVTLFNASGQRVLGPLSGTGSSLPLEVSKLGTGIYFVRIVQGGSVQTTEILIR